MDQAQSITSYVDHLPAVLREDPILVAVARVFEAILSGTGAARGPSPGLELQLGLLHRIFTPGPELPDGERAPSDFLPWLASWVALGLRDDWDDAVRRRFVAGALQLYRMRGTKAGLIAAIELYTGEPRSVTIYEFERPPHFFQVEVQQRSSDPVLLARTDRVLRAIIEQDKPAHTIYGLKIMFPTMKIVDHPTLPGEGIYVGVNTTLGTRTFSG